MVKKYRLIVSFLLAVYVLYTALPFFWHYFYSQETITFLKLGGLNASLKLPEFYTYAFPVIYVLVCIGLLRFNFLARIMFLALVLFNLIIGAFFLGFSASAYLDSLISYTLSLLEGVILYIIYFSELSLRFKNSKA